MSAAADISGPGVGTRTQDQLRHHQCHWPGCTKQVPPAMWGCRPHWARLPQALRTRIWTTYVAGQETTKTPSARYLAAAQAVQQWIQDRRLGICVCGHPEHQHDPNDNRCVVTAERGSITTEFDDGRDTAHAYCDCLRYRPGTGPSEPT